MKNKNHNIATGLSADQKLISEIEKKLKEIEEVRHGKHSLTVNIHSESIHINALGQVNVEKLFSETIQPLIHNLPPYGFHVYFTPNAKNTMTKPTRRMLEAYIYMKHAGEL